MVGLRGLPNETPQLSQFLLYVFGGGLMEFEVLLMGTEEVRKVKEVVRTLDIELDDETRVELTVIRSGGLSIQSFRDCGRGERPFYRLEGSAAISPADIVEWIKTLCEALGLETGYSNPTPSTPLCSAQQRLITLQCTLSLHRSQKMNATSSAYQT